MFQFFCTHFYAPKIQSQIQHFVKTCTARQDEKRLPQRYAPGLSKTMSNITERLSCFYIDCVKLTKGRLGHKYLFTLMDPNTRWLEAYPIRNTNSQNVARILESEIFPRYGYNLLFCLRSRKRVHRKVDYKQHHYFGTAYHHPNSNSVEWAHRSLLNLIRAELSDWNLMREKWVECLPRALAKLRMAPDESHTCAFSRVFWLPACTGISQIAPQRIQLVPTEVLQETDKEIKVKNQDPETGETFVRTLQKIIDSLYAEHVNCVSNLNVNM